MSKLNELVARCKCGVHISVNEHKNYYQTAAEYLVDSIRDNDEYNSMLDEIREMESRDSIIEIQFYQHTPIGFIKVWHYDLEMALDEAIAALD